MHGWLFFIFIVPFLSAVQSYFAKLMGTQCIPQAEFFPGLEQAPAAAAGWNA
jgi:hypothetical protein